MTRKCGTWTDCSITAVMQCSLFLQCNRIVEVTLMFGESAVGKGVGNVKSCKQALVGKMDGDRGQVYM